MTNKDYLFNLPDESFAQFLIQSSKEYTEDILSEEPGSYYAETVYFAPNGKKYWDLDDAIDATVAWLNRERLRADYA